MLFSVYVTSLCKYKDGHHGYNAAICSYTTPLLDILLCTNYLVLLVNSSASSEWNTTQIPGDVENCSGNVPVGLRHVVMLLWLSRTTSGRRLPVISDTSSHACTPHCDHCRQSPNTRCPGPWIASGSLPCQTSLRLILCLIGRSDGLLAHKTRQ